MKTPFTMWTNLAFPLVGLYTLLAHLTPASAVFCAGMLYLGYGSGKFHITDVWVKKYADLDVSAMYAVYGGLLFYAIAVLIGLPAAITGIAMMGVSINAAYWLRYVHPGQLHLRIGIALVAALLAILAENMAALGPVLVMLALFAVSFGLRELDARGLLKYGHGWWHIGTAGATGMLFSIIAGVL